MVNNSHSNHHSNNNNNHDKPLFNYIFKNSKELEFLINISKLQHTFSQIQAHLSPPFHHHNNPNRPPHTSSLLSRLSAFHQQQRSFLANSTTFSSFFNNNTNSNNDLAQLQLNYLPSSSSPSSPSPLEQQQQQQSITSDHSSLFLRKHSDNDSTGGGGSSDHSGSTSDISNSNNNNNDENDSRSKRSEIHNYWDYKQPHHFEFDNVSKVRRFFTLCGTVFFGYMCKAWMKLFHTITFINRESFEDLIWVHWLNLQRLKKEKQKMLQQQQREGKEISAGEIVGEVEEGEEIGMDEVKVPGLLTVLNHASMMDEPFLFANLIPSKWYFHPEILRSPICAADQCFANFVFAEVAKTLRVLPMQRGGSINQSAMDIAIHKLSTGHWISVFPEGYIKQDGEIHTIRRGVGKLILESDPTPRVYPIYHRGMEGVKSERKWLPSFGSHVVVKLGDEIHFNDLIEDFKNGKMSADDTYILIANRIQKKLNDLKKEVDEYRAQHNIRNKAEDEV